MKKNIANLPTLSIKHNEIITDIKQKERGIPELNAKKKRLIDANEALSSYINYEISAEYLKNISKIEKIDEEIAKIKKMRLDYFIKNADVIFMYNELDKTNLVMTPIPVMSTSEDIIKCPQTKPASNNIFLSNNCFKNKTGKVSESYSGTSSISKADLLKKYLLNNDPDYNHLFQYIDEEQPVKICNAKINKNTYCYKCDRYRDLNEHEAKLYCYNCGESVPVILESDKPSSKDYPIETRHYEYKKFNHFCYWLAKIQGKESCDIPREVIETIKTDLKRDKITNLSLLNETDIKEYLKKYKNIGYEKYYNHTIFILMEITGIQPIILSLEQEREYKMMFIIIQELYELYKPDDRSNFGSYSYIIYKFAQLRGDVEIMKKMKLLKCKEKLHNLDVIWQKICNHLGGAEKGWRYIPTY